MTDLIPGVKYRIQHVDLQMYLELLDPTAPTPAVDNAGLRPMEENDSQYWTFERVPYNSGYCYVRNVANTNHCLGLNSAIDTYTGEASSHSSLVNVTNLSDGTYQLACVYRDNYYYWYSTAHSTAATRLMLDYRAYDEVHKWQLVPAATPQPVKNYPLETGEVYRIRNLDGRSLLTCDKDDNAVYIESQLDQTNYYQRWNVTFEQDSGTYIVQNAGSNLYLGCLSTSSSSDDTLVGAVETAFQWDVQIIEGFAVSFCILANEKLSVGLTDCEVGRECEPRLQVVSIDITPNQMWYMENLKFIHNKYHPLPEGKYFLQSCHDLDQTIYMTGACSPYRITTGTAATSEFDLKYVDKKSALFTLTYVTDANVVPVVADGGEYITLQRKGTQFVLVKQARGQCLICLPDSGDPPKVVSARITTDIDDNPVFPIEDETGDALQKWNFIPVQ